MKNVEIDPDIKKEYENQRRYLENSQQSLKKRLEKEQQIHKEDNMNIMRENIKLIKMISDLRTEVKELVSKEKNTRTIAKMRANQSQMMQGSKVGDEGSNQNSSRVNGGGMNEEQAA
jgi:protein subunit release factor B